MVWKQKRVWLFYYFYCERNYDGLKLKIPSFLLCKNIKINKNKAEWKMEYLTHSFREITHVLQFALEWRIKSKTPMSWSSRKKEESIFCNVYFVRRTFFNIWVLSQCIVYWINFPNIYTFSCEKLFLYALLLLAF